MKKLFGILAMIIFASCHPAHAGSTIVHGTVTNVKPVYTQVVQQTPRQVCKQVQVPIYGQSQGTNSGNAILGAIIGGGWSGHRFYDDYLDMKQQVQDFAPTEKTLGLLDRPDETNEQNLLDRR